MSSVRGECMLKSMTGYGKGEAATDRGRFTVEIRSVNHRYNEVSVRMPRMFLALENDVRKLVSARIKRGKTDVTVQWVETLSAASSPQIDASLAKTLYQTFSGLQQELGLSGEIPLSLIISQKGVVCESGEADDQLDDCFPLLLEAVGNAVDAIDAMRIREGDALSADLAGRRLQLAEWTGVIKERTPQVVEEYRQKLKNRLVQLLEGTPLDEGRLAQEVALMADRCDITEELVRLSSHFKQFDDALALKEPVGRKLDFLMQEMNREVNTIGSKSSDSEITSLVISIKAEMEKMREQVQNIE